MRRARTRRAGDAVDASGATIATTPCRSCAPCASPIRPWPRPATSTIWERMIEAALAEAGRRRRHRPSSGQISQRHSRRAARAAAPDRQVEDPDRPHPPAACRACACRERDPQDRGAAEDGEQRAAPHKDRAASGQLARSGAEPAEREQPERRCPTIVARAASSSAASTPLGGGGVGRRLMRRSPPRPARRRGSG